MSVEIKGLNSLAVNLTGALQGVIDQISTELVWGAEDIEGRAKVTVNSSAKDRGQLQSSIQSDITNPLDVSVSAAAPHAPYVEFGTGPRFNANGRESYAAQFKGPTGQPFAKMVDSIYEWLRRTGRFPPEAKTEAAKRSYAKFVSLKILKNGLKPRPFLFKAFDEVMPEVISAVKEILK